jgi:catechol 2,3-dioxygenase-like lactoylglutathione lyase family enzyme
MQIYPRLVRRWSIGAAAVRSLRSTNGPSQVTAQHTLASWEVSDLRAAVDQLRDRGVRFEQYDLPEVKTEDGISTTGDLREAWFRDPDGNILRIHSHVET